jgi:short-subunit dehydrogenase
MEFQQKYGPWALVVGASEGLGAAFADGCAQRGLNVAIAARRAAALDEVAKRLEARHGVQTRKIVADAGAPDLIETLKAGVEGVEVGFVIYNCAAEPGGRFLDIGLADHINNIQVNCTAPTALVHWLGREMVARGRGGIVLVSSMAALNGLRSWVSYGAAKAYEMILGEGLWDELRLAGVDATGYVVGSTYTPNFQRIQKKLDSPFAKSIDPKDYPDGAPLPRTPELVAANLFAQFPGGPRLYSHPDDKAGAELGATLPRDQLVLAAGEGSEKFFKGGMNDLGS